MFAAAMTWIAQPQSIDATAATDPTVFASVIEVEHWGISDQKKNTHSLRPNIENFAIAVKKGCTSKNIAVEEPSVDLQAFGIVSRLHTPPEVGAADANSAIDIPTHKIKKLATAHLRIS